MARKSKEEWKIRGNVFDQHTEKVIRSFISKGAIDGLYGAISLGKEANIFIAKQGSKSLVAKIYRLENCSFNRMYDYIKADPRYISLKKRRREIVFSWVQREFRNLLKARDAQVRVPLPIDFKDHVILMEHIGDDRPAPQLKDTVPKNIQRFAATVVDYMSKLYRSGLVHGDLSAFNILNHREQPVFIDFSQSTTTESSLADELLERDMQNVHSYFKKHGYDFDVKQNFKNNL